MTHTTHSTPRPAPDAPFSSDASGEPHTEAGAGDGAEAPALLTDAKLDELDGRLSRVGWYIIEGGQRYVDDAPMEARTAIQQLRGQLAAMTAERDALVGASLDLAYSMRVIRDNTTSPGSKSVAASALRRWESQPTTALDHMLAQAKAEGMREAAAMLNEDVMIREADASRFRQGSDPHYYRMDRARVVKDHADAILAAAQKEAWAKSGSPKWGPSFPPSSCNAWEDCAHDGVCYDPAGCNGGSMNTYEDEEPRHD